MTNDLWCQLVRRTDVQCVHITNNETIEPGSLNDLLTYYYLFVTYLERTIRAWQVQVDHHNYLLLHLQVLRDLSQDGVQLDDAQFLPTSTPRTYLGEMATIFHARPVRITTVCFKLFGLPLDHNTG